MRDIYLKRNELCKKSIELRTAKFDPLIKDKRTDELIKAQDKIYKKYKFYDDYIKTINKEKEELK